jgi:hypothetical protein
MDIEEGQEVQAKGIGNKIIAETSQIFRKRFL